MKPLLCAILSVLLLAAGCITEAQHPAATQPSTWQDPSTTQPSYWLNQPAEVTIHGDDFEKLWKACEQSARDYMFQLDRQDYRSGLLTTVPLTSAQWFELWRQDVKTINDAELSSIATIRRTATFQFQKNPDGSYDVTPRVLVERQTIAEKRITSVTTYSGIFALARDPNDNPSGTPESDQGIIIRPRYWYALGRDAALERDLARSVEKKLRD